MNESTSQPLYLQVKQKIMDRIQSGEFKDGDMLPTESVLQKEYEVSRATIRNALDEIEKEQLILRKRGVGTTIHKRKFKKELMKLQSFSSLMASRGLKPRTEILSVEISDVPIEVEEYSKQQISEKSWFIKRILLANEKPIGLQHLYFPTSLIFSPDELSSMESFYELINQRHGIKPYVGEETLTATVANKETADLLQISEGNPLLDIWRTTFDEKASVFEVCHLLYIADLYEYHFKLYS